MNKAVKELPSTSAKRYPSKQLKLYEKTKDDIHFWTRRLRLTPSMLFVVPDDILDRLLKSTYQGTIRKDLRKEQIRRMKDILCADILRLGDKMQRLQVFESYNQFSKIKELKNVAEIRLQKGIEGLEKIQAV